ncbi:MAG: ribonuclease III [Magnetococcales bacterium]|nr:ribonuclease III [Magnetococcales bacterium]
MTETDALARWSKEALDYAFGEIALLQLALTHRSVAQDGILAHNERLEFLGDAVLNLAVAQLLYHRFPEEMEGEMSHLRAMLVNTAALGRIGEELALGEWLRLGRGETRSGGREKPSILGNSLEAVLGAVFLDGGWSGVEQVTRRLLTPSLERLVVEAPSRDGKTVLQEWLQARGAALPEYRLEEVGGMAHERLFQVTCRVNPQVTGRGAGRTKRQAEQEAAREALRLLQEESRTT